MQDIIDLNQGGLTSQYLIFVLICSAIFSTKVMIGDNLSSHLSDRVMSACREHNIRFILLLNLLGEMFYSIGSKKKQRLYSKGSISKIIKTNS